MLPAYDLHKAALDSTLFTIIPKEALTFDALLAKDDTGRTPLSLLPADGLWEPEDIANKLNECGSGFKPWQIARLLREGCGYSASTVARALHSADGLDLPYHDVGNALYFPEGLNLDATATTLALREGCGLTPAEIAEVLPPDATRPYRLFCNGLAATVFVPRDFSADQWESLRLRFLDMAVSDPDEGEWAHVWNLPLLSDRIHAGVPWHEELAGPDGMSYVLLPSGYVGDAAIHACEEFIRRTGDVVRLRVLRPERELGPTEAVNLVNPPAAGVEQALPGQASPEASAMRSALEEIVRSEPLDVSDVYEWITGIKRLASRTLAEFPVPAPEDSNMDQPLPTGSASTGSVKR